MSNITLIRGIKDNSNENITNTLGKGQKTNSVVTFGDMAYRSESILHIDKNSLNIKNDTEARGMLKGEYREPY